MLLNQKSGVLILFNLSGCFSEAKRRPLIWRIPGLPLNGKEPERSGAFSRHQNLDAKLHVKGGRWYNPAAIICKTAKSRVAFIYQVPKEAK